MDATTTECSCSKESELHVMNVDEAVEIMGFKLPDSTACLSKYYSNKIIKLVTSKTISEKGAMVSNAYTSMFATLISQQIEESGSFDIEIDFSEFEKIPIFPKSPKGVDICPVCNGVGGIVKFGKKPKEIECLKCKSQDFMYYDIKLQKKRHVIIEGPSITVDGIDHTKHPYYKRFLGWRIEDCRSCDGTGRVIEDCIDEDTGKKIDLIINVKCRSCKGRKYHPNSKKTQVLTKCRTCQGDRLAKLMVITPEIQNITSCKKCNGFGYIRPQPKPDNPVLTPDLAAKIRLL